MADALGVTMLCGFAEVPKEYAHPSDLGSVIFTKDNGCLVEHPITRGRSESESLNCVMSFTGQSLNSSTGIPILALPDSSIEYVPPPPDFQPVLAGEAQGYAIEFGNGRIVVLGEAGMLTAQVSGDGEKFGMNAPGLDNKQFALNIMHWLSRLL
jgi:hypothetical protein